MIGSVTVGVLTDRFQKYTDTIVSCTLFLMGTCLILRPWSSSLHVLCINTFLDGFAGGALNAGKSIGNRFIRESIFYGIQIQSDS